MKLTTNRIKDALIVIGLVIIGIAVYYYVTAEHSEDSKVIIIKVKR